MLTYELRLGVTGHRDLGNEPEFAHAIKRLLDRIEATLGDQTVSPVSWTVVSALARGADRLFAESVLEDKRGRLEVVTPFAVAEYQRDFQSGPDREEFDRLLAMAQQVDRLAGDPAAGRQAAYLRAGEHVVDTSEIVIAIWDGRPSTGGGTGDVVEYAVKHGRIVLWLDSDDPDAPYRVIRSVKYDGDGRLATGGCEEFPQTARGLSHGYHQQTRYCLDAAVSASACDARFSTRRDSLLSAARAVGLEADALPSVSGESTRQFVRADLLAEFYQTRHSWLSVGVPYLAAAAVTVAVGQVLFFPERPEIILLEILAMVFVLALWWWGKREAWHEKWLQDRYLAERLRAATFLALVGVHASEARRDDPLPFYRGPRHWLVRFADLLTCSPPPQAVPFEPLKQWVVSHWLVEQRDHHARSAAKRRRAVRWQHRVGLSLFWLTLFMAIFHFAGVGHAHEAIGPGLRRIDLWITFLALTLPAWAGAVHATASQLELERLAARSAQMARALDQAVRRANRATSVDELREVCRGAGSLMAGENHEWWVLLSFQGPHLHV